MVTDKWSLGQRQEATFAKLDLLALGTAFLSEHLIGHQLVLGI